MNSPGKVLLFGEYAILKGGDALAIPLHDIGGRLSLEKANGWSESNASITLFFGYIDKIKENLGIVELDLNKLQADIQKGLWFNSNIPLQSGLGSSGALVAAVVHEYASIKDDSIDSLKKDLALLESHFHGHSSGIDPLVSYTGETVHIENGNTNIVELAKLPDFERVPILGKGSTGALVGKFLLDLEKNDYSELFFNNYVPLQNSIINQITATDIPVSKESILELSALQFELFGAMISADLSASWKRGLRTKDFALKLCGSGGGGFVLRFNF